jgi:amidase
LKVKKNIDYFKGEFDEFSIKDFQTLMKKGKLSSLEIVNYYLDRIDKLDRNGPILNSVLELNSDAKSIAKISDEKRTRTKDKASIPELYGIPVLLKGNIDTADKMTTTAGSLSLAGNYPEKDAEIVKKLREAGAVILGKTNLSEWANFRSTKSSSGWSSQGGQTKNPYILDRSPCGSSSGSGTAVSANLCAAAIGTETDGSIICPSSVNGIVGFKSTIGLVSQKGIIPISFSQDTAGPMARSVADASILFDVIGKKPSKIGSESNNVPMLKNLSGIRIGVVRNFFGVNYEVDEVIEDSLLIM